MPALPWDNGSFMPWQVGQVFVGPDGATYQVYSDPNSPTKYTVKRTDANGTSFQPMNAPNDPNAAATAFENSPYGKRLTTAEKAAVDQNDFNRGITQGNLDVNRQNADTTRSTNQANVEQAKKQLQFQYAQLQQTGQMARGNLGLQTLQLGAGLHGPRNWDSYLETASQAGRNPILGQALDSWATLTGARPNTGAVSGGMPQRFDLNALASDFGVGGGGGQGGGGGYDPMKNRNSALDTVAMQPGAAQPGWWQGLSGSERERATGYWEQRGWDPSSILNSLSYTAPNQNLGYSGA